MRAIQGEGVMEELSTVDVLIQARGLIEDESRWWQIRPDVSKVEQWCALTALGKTTRNDVSHPAFGAVSRAMGCWQYQISAFNDAHTHAEVLAAFDTALANERAKEQEFTVTPVSGPVVAA